jgi:stage V sporulation protein R
MILTPELATLRDEIRQYAIEYDLDFFEVIYEILDFKEMNVVASYGGFPSRYPHWRFGMEYEQISKSYAYGLSKIYEMVINNDPCYAYLLYCNHIVDQKIVMAHVYGHSDFFKNNLYFGHTNRKMMDEMGNHRTKLQRLINKHGLEVVENFIDACLTLDNLIDSHLPMKRQASTSPSPLLDKKGDVESLEVKKMKSKGYMDKYINPKKFMEEEQKKLDDMEEHERDFPEKPERDVLQFLIHYAPLEDWQREVLEIIREEAYYFLPQGQTKIMNEGWAAYWHSEIMTKKALKDDEIIDYADHNAGTLAVHPGRLNPYKLGVELLRDIEERWNRGQFGSEYDECPNLEEKKAWNKQLGLGRDKIFEVRRLYNDVTFLDTFLTPEFCSRQKLFTYNYNPANGAYEITHREFQEIKKKLLLSLTNMGSPIIEVVNGNYDNKRELLLKHSHEGVDLRVDYGKETLKNLYNIWKRPVHIETKIDEVPRMLSFDGKEYQEKRL